ncbi:hypothetical protein M9Y10_009138 [Tritrichomonas musculus]|uniref:Uncharacterized protein n=1 Tax=Tritrichomonas musculus TaxID=1915356 RepID=A0ABR2J093_9EUKA
MTEVKDATIYITGYEWGPGVSKVIVSFTKPVEKVSKEGASIRTDKKDREIKAIYLSNARGDQVNESSAYVTLELDIVFDMEVNCNPFYYNLQTFKNEWAKEYIVKAEFKVISEGKDTLIKLEKDCINNRICPDTELFSNRGIFSGKYQNPITKKEDMLSLRYAAYEPKELKEDNAKNPLIIWINGGGEGGLDIDIALLGNKVTALAGPKIQSYFTSENGAKGIYVLAIQTPTLWMDGGNDQFHNGDFDSRYSGIFMDLLKDYLSKNPDVDQNRIYIGGCSNGGFMSLNMVISHPDFFAASYHICEIYAYNYFQRDEKGDYIQDKNNSEILTAKIPTDKRYFTDEKMNSIKDSPMWFIQSDNDGTVVPKLFSFPSYRQLLKLGGKNIWYSYFKTVEGTDMPGEDYNGHWSWVYFFNDQVTRVQNRDKIKNSTDNEKFGFEPKNEGGGSEKAVDDKGTYDSIFAWLNAQVKH